MPDLLVPFGKYKGQPAEVLQTDHNYTEWLIQQPWFGEKHPDIKILIVNNFKEANESPAHNELQSRFIDKQYLFNVANTLHDGDGSEFKKNTEESIFNHFARFRGTFEIAFELHGWDVIVSSWIWKNELVFNTTLLGEEDNRHFYSKYLFELKPTLGEDFSSVLRTVIARHQATIQKRDDKFMGYGEFQVVVFVDHFTALSVPLEVVKKMFASSGVRLALSSEVVHCPWERPFFGH